LVTNIITQVRALRYAIGRIEWLRVIPVNRNILPPTTTQTTVTLGLKHPSQQYNEQGI
ncbi:hypothetical protein HHI36_008889, partial [Cryptolaemus montrouzieri]